MKKLIFLVFIFATLAGCKKGDNSTPTPPPGGVTITTVTLASFQLPDGSGNPTRVYVQNTNTGETPFVLDVRPTGIYSLRFSGLGGRAMTGTPRAGTTNIVGFNAGVGDTLILSKNGVENIRAIFGNDNLNILNGGIFVERNGSLETNAQAGARINTYSTGAMLTQKFQM